MHAEHPLSMPTTSESVSKVVIVLALTSLCLACMAIALRANSLKLRYLHLAFEPCSVVIFSSYRPLTRIFFECVAA